jgi:hypothetical protein
MVEGQWHDLDCAVPPLKIDRRYALQIADGFTPDLYWLNK